MARMAENHFSQERKQDGRRENTKSLQYGNPNTHQLHSQRLIADTAGAGFPGALPATAVRSNHATLWRRIGLTQDCASQATWRFPDDLLVEQNTKASYRDFLPQIPQPFALHGEVQEAKRAIFTEAFLQGDSSVGLLVGPQACGKSTVAAALARDAQVQAMYPGGVMWVLCGEGATPLWVLRQLWELVQRVSLASRALWGDDRIVILFANKVGACSNEATLSQELVQTLSCQKTLLILDDVRDARVARACNPLGSHLLCTTFQASLCKRLQTAVSSAGVRVYEMRVLTRSNMQILLRSHFLFQNVDPSLMESLHSMIGRLPLELVLVSFLFQVVKSFVSYDNDALMSAVMKRLLVSHHTLQEQLHNDAGVQHLSQSHTFCWRTLAVTLELFPPIYRRCMFQLALVPPGTRLSSALLQELWDLPESEISSAVSLFTCVCMLLPIPTPDGPRWHISNLAQDYLVYWARLTGKGAEVGQLHNWLLGDLERAARICNPFCAVSHSLITRNPPATAEALRLTASGCNMNVDPVLERAVKEVLHLPLGVMNPEMHAGLATSLAAAAVDLQLTQQAMDLLKHALNIFRSCLPSTRLALLRCQLSFSYANVLLAVGKPNEAMHELENILRETQDSSLFAPYVQHQLIRALLRGAYESEDAELALSLATVRSQMALELYGPGVQHAAALGELVNAQLFKCAKPSAIKQTIKLARQTLENCSRHFTLLHLNLERAVIAYYLFIGRIPDVEAKMCKLYLQIQQVYDPHHEIAALLMNDIALCLNIQGNFADAQDMLVEALALFERPGATTMTQQACLLAHNNLAVSLAALGRPLDAQKHLRVALKGIRAMKSPFIQQHPTLHLHASLLIQFKEFEAAKKYLLNAIINYSNPCRRRASAAAAALETLALLFIAQADPVSAEVCLDESLGVAQIVASERCMRQLNEVEVSKAYFLLSLISDQLGKKEKSKQCKEKFQSILEANRAHPFLLWAASVDKLEALYQRLMGIAPQETARFVKAGSGSAKTNGLLKSPVVSPRVIHSDPELEQVEMLK